MSSGSIISTASSNSPKVTKDKRHKFIGQQSLQIAGMQIGSNRKQTHNYIQKFDNRNKYQNKEGNSSVVSHGNRNGVLSMAARKKDN
jgi:hypothetical protein